MILRHKFILIFLMLMSGPLINALAQVKSNQEIERKMNLYATKNTSPLLYLHFDKTVYTGGETAWFTGYLLGAPIQPFTTISIALISDEDRTVVLENKFEINRGLCFGSPAIPNDITPGNYTFTAITNQLKNGEPVTLFTQPITIKSTEYEGFTAKLIAIDTAKTAKEKKVRLQVSIKDQNSIQDSALRAVSFSYYMGNSDRPVLSGTGKTYTNSYDFNLPSYLIGPASNTLHLKLFFNNAVRELAMQFPIRNDRPIIKFYPEGGNLVSNTTTKVGWEVKNIQGNPMGVTALLYRNGSIIDTISTGSYGMGLFTLSPNLKDIYTIRLAGNSSADTIYQLPAVICPSPAISLPKALVNDTLVVKITNPSGKSVQLFIHNGEVIYFSATLQPNLTEKTMRFTLANVPRGLARLTLIDSVGRPFAERTFFAHYNNLKSLNISIYKESYIKRQVVKLKVALTSQLPDSGFVSIACVQDNRIELKKKNDIETFTYLRHELGQIPLRNNYFEQNPDNSKYLESVLLVKGWTRFSWTDMLKMKPSDTLFEYKNLMIRGRIKKLGKALSSRAKIGMINNGLHSFETDSSGTFLLPNDYLRTEFEKNVEIQVLGSNAMTYSMKLYDPYVIVNERLSEQLKPIDYTGFGNENTMYLQLPSDEYAIQLKEVNITGRNNNSLYERSIKKQSMYSYQLTNIDVVNSISGSPKATTVTVYEIPGTPSSYKQKLKGIYTSKEFYAPDYSKNPEEQQYHSTLYWNHLIKISSNKASELSFYTGDITGSFRIVAQGITTSGVIHSESTFTINR